MNIHIESNNNDNMKIAEILTDGEKKAIYGIYKRIAGKLRKDGTPYADAQDITANSLVRIFSRRLREVFPKGLPVSERQWVAFLKKDTNYEVMRFYRTEWRHPTDSLDETVDFNDCAGKSDELSLIDTLDADKDILYTTNIKDDFLRTPEARHELQYVRRVVAKLCVGKSPRVRAVITGLV